MTMASTLFWKQLSITCKSESILFEAGKPVKITVTFQGPKDLNTVCIPIIVRVTEEGWREVWVRQEFLLVNLEATPRKAFLCSKGKNRNSQNYLGKIKSSWQLLWSDSVEKAIDLSPPFNTTTNSSQKVLGMRLFPEHYTICPHTSSEVHISEA